MNLVTHVAMWCLLHIESGEVNIAKVAIKRDIDEELVFLRHLCFIHQSPHRLGGGRLPV